MSKVVKQMEMEDLTQTFKDVKDLVLLSVSGLNATVDNQIRLGLRKKNIRFRVVKNTLAQRVFASLGVTIGDVWTGPTTVAWGAGSAAELAKEVDAIARKHDKAFKVKTGVAEGQPIAFDQMVKLPTRTEAIANVIMLMLSPARRLAGQIIGPGGALASQIKKIGEKKEEPAAAPAAPAA